MELTTYQKEFLPAFVSLNRQWIETYFAIEPMDLQQLENPELFILKNGGEIFFVIEDSQAVGTCAMIPHGENCYELAKMAVSPVCRGKGYGDLLMKAAIDWAKARKTKKIMLLSNTILEAAITLYQKHGFKTIHLGTHPDYKRSNIEMELDL